MDTSLLRTPLGTMSVGDPSWIFYSHLGESSSLTPIPALLTPLSVLPTYVSPRSFQSVKNVPTLLYL